MCSEKIKIASLHNLKLKARMFLLEHCVSKRGADVMVFGFTGYLNGDEVDNVTLHRNLGCWEIFRTKQTVQSLKGTIDFFSVTRETIL